MNFRLVTATARRVQQQLRHDPRSMAMILVMPSALLVLFYFVFWDYEQLFQRIAPIMIAFFPLFLLFVVTSVSMQRERSSGTLERLFTTRARSTELIGGYGLAFGALAVVQAVVMYVISDFLLDVTSAAPWWFTMLISAVTGLTGVAMGLFTSAFARSEFQAVQFIPVLIVPQALLCGLFVPRDELPALLHWVSDVLPMSYAVDAVVEATASGMSGHVWLKVGVCVAFALVFLLLASVSMPRKSK